MRRNASTVKEYLDTLTPEWRKAINALRKVIKKNLSKEYKEGIQWGAISYYIPHSVYPPGYHCDPKQALPFAGLAAQKNHMSISLMCIYGNKGEEAKFRKEWKATGKKLDMGKACVRFKKLEDVPLEVIGRAIKRMPAKKYIAGYEAAYGKSAARQKKGKR